MKPKSSSYPLSLLINRELSEIDFVQSYYQLVFQETRLSVYSNNSQIKVNNNLYDTQSDLFYRLIINCINQFVKKINITENESIKLTFTNGYLLAISLKPEDYVGPEAAMFTDHDTNVWNVW